MRTIIVLVVGVIPLVSHPAVYVHPEIVNVSPIIQQLAECESGNNPKAINPNDPDTPSFGLLQFKQGTFEIFGKKYNLPHDDIMNPEQQIAIAEKMLENNLWTHWFNCLKGRYLPADRHGLTLK